MDTVDNEHNMWRFLSTSCTQDVGIFMLRWYFYVTLVSSSTSSVSDQTQIYSQSNYGRVDRNL